MAKSKKKEYNKRQHEEGFKRIKDPSKKKMKKVRTLDYV